MSIATVVWCMAGLALGVLQALSLWRATHGVPRVPTAMLRVASVALVFIVAALVGRILPVASGWACGFPLAAAALYLRKQI